MTRSNKSVIELIAEDMADDGDVEVSNTKPVPKDVTEDIESIAAEMTEDLSSNNGLREGVSFLPPAPASSRSPLFERHARSSRYDFDPELDPYVSTPASMAPYRLPVNPHKQISESKAKPVVIQKTVAHKSAPAEPIPAPAPVAPEAPKPAFGLGDRQLEL